ncbi:MAG: 23S rRNA (guanosine(2251)-2'-O)-methyltransferase RlmB [Chlorobiota bacterium]
MSENYIYGRNAVVQAIESDKVEKVFIGFGAQGASVNRIFKIAKNNGVPISKYDKRKFKELEKKANIKNNVSQNVIALAKQVQTVSIIELMDYANSESKKPVLVALDGITDPQNLGAIARTAECVGASGIIITERNSSPINSFAIKASAGALNKIPVCRVTNLASELTNLKEHGFWVVGTDLEATNSYTDDIYDSPIIVVIGSEDKGMRPRVKKVCDHLVKIPMKGSTQSLNASVSSGIILFEIFRQKDN